MFIFLYLEHQSFDKKSPLLGVYETNEGPCESVR